MPRDNPTGIGHFIQAFVNSMRGLQAVFRHEAAARQELLFAVVMSVIAFCLADTLAVLLILLILPWMILVVELLNSAIEKTLDRISQEEHELAGRAKDMGSAAVFMMAFITCAAYLIVIINKCC